ncbi:hypothetical protein F5X68DRAFT_239179 [Plectosphaerella plurivora]|uniref:LysM domain-containing protein n=1 Tax=Plectosphaerella plurivora TaxID=936078 RepID=A0A9P8VCH6_9PEZI|nr:hypothetical protein F5X68DRAFT_239179 [Plectosphaerella plurivora]
MARHSFSVSTLVAGLLLQSAIVAAFNPQPAFPYHPSTTDKCTWWFDSDGTWSCQDVEDYAWVNLGDFMRWNPIVTPESCAAGLLPEGVSYCADGPAEVVTTSTITTTSTVSSSTAKPPTTTTRPTTPTSTIKPTTTVKPTTTSSAKPTGNGISTPQPTQSGMVSNCNKFYKIKDGDNCDKIASAHKIPVTVIPKWNSVGGAACTALWKDSYACVSTVGYVAPTPTTTTSAGNGIATPQPTQPGMVKNCDRFVKVASGQTCAVIGANAVVLAQRIINWNTGVGAQCTGLQANVYVCVRTIGFTQTTQRTCSSASTDKTWGGNKAAALAAGKNWCDNVGRGAYTIAQAKSGCKNAAQGNNLFYFESRNLFQAPITLSVARCNDIMANLINGCERGGVANQEGWNIRAYVRAGQC